MKSSLNKKLWIVKKTCALILIFAHLFLILPFKEVWAQQSSASYILELDSLASGGLNRTSPLGNLAQDATSEPLSGRSLSTHYRLSSGFVLGLNTEGLVQRQGNPGYTWEELSLTYACQGTNYGLARSLWGEEGGVRSSSNYRLLPGAGGEAISGKTQSANYVLQSGLIPACQIPGPKQIKIIPNLSWKKNECFNNALDLDDYFEAFVQGSLRYAPVGNRLTGVSINPVTNQVSLNSTQDFIGEETIRFKAIDPEGNPTLSNPLSLMVLDKSDNPPQLDYIPDIAVNETELVHIQPHASDADGDTITFGFTSPLDNQGKWQTSYTDAGTYVAKVTAIDSTGLFDSQEVKVVVRNKNRAPQINKINGISVQPGQILALGPSPEGELLNLKVEVSDPDGEPISLYYSSPLDEAGSWRIPEGASLNSPYYSVITASDKTDTISQTVSIEVGDVNKPPVVELSLSTYTARPEEVIEVRLSASDPDGDNMGFSLKKDGVEFSSGVISSTYQTTVSFSAIGDHTIEATVTDSQGHSTTVLREVDIPDPNSPSWSISPLMGDFNGDSLTDVGLYDHSKGLWEVALSYQGKFYAAQDWLTNFGIGYDTIPIGGDFNGDSLSDIGTYNTKDGTLQIGLSTGRSFSPPSTWYVAPAGLSPIGGNFNGDRYADLCLYDSSSGTFKVALSTGVSLGEFTDWGQGIVGPGWLGLSGDFNGDSLTDICAFEKSSGTFKVAFSNNHGFEPASTWIIGFATDKDPIVADLNGDGLTDIGYWDKDASTVYYAVSTGQAFVDNGILKQGLGTKDDLSGSAADFNGDGLNDFALFNSVEQGIRRWNILLSQGNPPDLISSIDNGTGGKIEVGYTYSGRFNNELLPFPVYVANSITLVDTLPTDQPEELYRQDFTYEGGYYDAGEREFRGFRKVTVKDPITGNYTQTYFIQGLPNQDGALKGKMEKVVAYDGNNQLISQTLNTWKVRKAGPNASPLGFPYLEETNSTVWEENQTSVSTQSSFVYDNLGNVTSLRNEGDLVKIGDEKIGTTTYAQAYEEGLNRILETTLQDKDRNLLSKQNFSYDTHGNLTQESTWLSNPLTMNYELLTTNYSYDSFGNLTSATNALGHTTTTEYETEFYTFPKVVTNPLGHKVSYIYEPRFGLITKGTDPNGQETFFAYDSLGRLTQRKSLVSGNWSLVAYQYPDFNTKITINAIGLSTTECADGLGRRYKTLSPGEDGQNRREVVTETFFNERGLVDRESLPHYLDEPENNISYVRYEYDLRGRPIQTISDFPGEASDASSTITYLSPLETETTDPLGHRKGVKKDIEGNTIEIIEYASDGIYHTYYEYDLKGNLSKLTDTLGNTTELTYDSLGRKLRMSDPDMGVWSYEYDLVGNLIKQTDAKGQVLEFSYDSLNRLIKKHLRGGTEGYSAEVSYWYDEPGKENGISRLSRVTDQSGSTEFFYDTQGREVRSIKRVDSSEFIVHREYDLLDRLTKLIYPDGAVVNYQYDQNSGLLERVFSTNYELSTTNYVKDLSYNAQGQIKTISYGNGTQTNYTYGPDLRLARILTQGPASVTLQDLHYQFDQNGNITTLTDNLKGNLREFSYDDLDRLTEARNAPSSSGGYQDLYYRYDPIGNLTYKSDLGFLSYGVGGGPHTVTSAGGYPYHYDANGNMTQGKGKTLEYDPENRLLKVADGDTMSLFTYDGDGGRVLQETRNQSTETRTLYIGSLFEIETRINTDGTRIAKDKKHIFAGGQRICTLEACDLQPEARSLYYFHPDHLSSSNLITDASGNLVQHCEYTPYGTLARNEGTDVAKHKFTGKELDPTGLYFFGARYYDPTLARFITADTIVQSPGDPQSLNRYSYCRNNPIIYIDPSGHWFWAAVIVGAILGGASAAINDQPIWQGVLMGAAGGLLVGGGAAAFGFWGAVGGGMLAGAGTTAATGGNIGFGALIGGLGAGLGYGLGSWASGWESGSFWGELGGAMFAGAVAGGVGAELGGGNFGQGAWMGAAYGSAGFFGSKAVNALDPRVRQLQRVQREARARHALNAKKNDMIKVPISSRDVSFFKLAGHQSMPGFEMGPDEFGYIKTSRTVADLSKWKTNIATQGTKSRGYTMAEVSASGLVDSQLWYEQNFVDTNTKYSPISGNSNFAMNTVIYSAGGSVPNALGWNPSCGTVPNSVFYPYVHRED